MVFVIVWWPLGNSHENTKAIPAGAPGWSTLPKVRARTLHPGIRLRSTSLTYAIARSFHIWFMLSPHTKTRRPDPFAVAHLVAGNATGRGPDLGWRSCH